MADKTKVNGSNANLQIPATAICCVNCGYSLMQRSNPSDIKQVRICKRLPPTPVNVGKGIMSLWPVVADHMACGEFSPSENAQRASSQGANEDAAFSAGGTD